MFCFHRQVDPPSSGTGCAVRCVVRQLLPILFLGLAILASLWWSHAPGGNAQAGAAAALGASAAESVRSVQNPAILSMVGYRIDRQFPDIRVKGVYRSPNRSVWLVMTSRGAFYMTRDYRFLFSGDMYNLRTGIDETRLHQVISRATRMVRDYLRQSPGTGVAQPPHEAKGIARMSDWLTPLPTPDRRGVNLRQKRGAVAGHAHLVPTGQRPSATSRPRATQAPGYSGEPPGTSPSQGSAAHVGRNGGVGGLSRSGKSHGGIASLEHTGRRMGEQPPLSHPSHTSAPSRMRGDNGAASTDAIDKELRQYQENLIAQVRKSAGLDGYSPGAAQAAESAGGAPATPEQSATPSATAASGASSADSDVPVVHNSHLLGQVPKIGYFKDGRPMTTAQKRAQVRRVYKKIPMNFTINFPAYGKPKGQILVFSDYSCPYCERLDRAVPALNRAGVTVRYLMFPRELAYGEHNPDAQHEIKEFTNAWCARDQQSAIHELYQTGVAPPASCKNLPKSDHRLQSPVLAHFALGELFGITGTPTIVYPNGVVKPGFPGVKGILRRLGISPR